MSEAVLIPCDRHWLDKCPPPRAIERHRLISDDGEKVIWQRLVCVGCAEWSRKDDAEFSEPHLVQYEPLIYPYANPEHDVMIELFCIAAARLLFRSDEDVAILRAAGEAARREKGKLCA